ncbi:hypothetical protein BKA57DRAFT_457172 [Linnemannia elongata]|nr:hypothetical protein BKA57DRAFT_457172 [Linnemannia elongata]
MRPHNYPPGKQRPVTTRPSPPSLARLFLIAVATSVILSNPALAQTPVPVCCMATAISDDSYLYIQGGFTSTATLRTAVPQFVALDLSVEVWSTSSPPWKWPLSLGTTPPTSTWHSMAVSKDRGYLFIWDPFQPNAWWTYIIGARYWSSFNIPLNVTMQPGIRSGVDMNTGIVFIPGGADNGTQMIMNTPGNSSVPLTLMPTTILPTPVVRASFVWSTYRNSFLHYGGQSIAGNISNPNLIEFSPTTGWQAVNTTGPSPGDVSGHCMVSAYSGTKMIVFGGAGLNGVTNAAIHILDLPTREWTLGESANATHARRNMACATSGDSFVAWGGESGLENKDSTPIVYDIRNNQWTNVFRRNTTLPVPTEPSTPIITVATTDFAAIGGGVAGAVLVAATVGFFIYRRRRPTKASNSNSKDNDGVGFSLREPQNTNGDRRTGHEVLHPPSLKPRPIDDRQTYFGHITVSPPTSPPSGPHGVLRDPHGQPRFGVIKGDKAEWFNDNDDNDEENNGHDGFEHPHPPQRPPIPARISQLSDRTMTISGPYQNGPLSNSVDIDINESYAEQLGPRNPQTPGSDGQYCEQTITQPIGPRGPQWRSQTNVSAQDMSARTGHIDRNQYLGRSQELARMMEAIRVEQEELERSRLEHESLMKNYQDPRSSPDP